MIHHKQSTPATELTSVTSAHLPPQAVAHANRTFWDTDAADYHQRHPIYLENFYWCPEMLHEATAKLLGDVSNHTVLEVGCGSAPCARWVHTHFPTAHVFGIDLSLEMLKHAGCFDKQSQPALRQADAQHLPFAAHTFDTVFSAFGAIPFVENLPALFTEIARVLTPGGRFVYATNHPMRWVFPDDPSKAGLTATIPYFNRTYAEQTDGRLTYAEFQHTMGDHIRALHHAGFHLTNLIEPEWPPELTVTWGQWSPLRGAIFPGTAIFSAQLHPNSGHDQQKPPAEPST